MIHRALFQEDIQKWIRIDSSALRFALQTLVVMLFILIGKSCIWSICFPLGLSTGDVDKLGNDIKETEQKDKV